MPRAAFWILLSGALILALSLGVRHGFGLFLAPMSADFGWGREVFAFAIALQNLVWGLAQPFTGRSPTATARRGRWWGPAVRPRPGPDGTLAVGQWAVAERRPADRPGPFRHLVLGDPRRRRRAVPAEQRNMAMGISSAAGSFGQFAMLPGTLGLIGWLGWSSALLALGLLVALIVPLAGLMKDRPLPPQGHEQSLGEALREACAHSGFWLLALGFFVCGFQVVFIGVHLPAYLVDQHLPAQVGTTVLALVGLFNVFGTYIAGWLGGRWSKPRLLTARCTWCAGSDRAVPLAAAERLQRPPSAWPWGCCGCPRCP